MKLSTIFSFKNRIGRLEFFWMSLVLGIVAQLNIHIAERTDNLLLAGFSVGVSFLAVWGSIATFVRRYHDLDKSGWALLCPVALLILSGVIGLASYFMMSRALVYVAVVLLAAGGVWAMGQSLLALFVPGKPNANQYGLPNSGSCKS